MKRKEKILETLASHFSKPEHLELVDESDKHSVPEGAESHFKLLLVSDQFEGQSRVQRQRQLYDLLADELSSGLHALTLRLLTKKEWEKKKSEFVSPDCQGRDKA